MLLRPGEGSELRQAFKLAALAAAVLALALVVRCCADQGDQVARSRELEDVPVWSLALELEARPRRPGGPGEERPGRRRAEGLDAGRWWLGPGAGRTGPPVRSAWRPRRATAGKVVHRSGGAAARDRTAARPGAPECETGPAGHGLGVPRDPGPRPAPSTGRSARPARAQVDRGVDLVPADDPRQARPREAARAHRRARLRRKSSARGQVAKCVEPSRFKGWRTPRRVRTHRMRAPHGQVDGSPTSWSSAARRSAASAGGVGMAWFLEPASGPALPGTTSPPPMAPPTRAQLAGARTLPATMLETQGQAAGRLEGNGGREGRGPAMVEIRRPGGGDGRADFTVEVAIQRGGSGPFVPWDPGGVVEITPAFEAELERRLEQLEVGESVTFELEAGGIHDGNLDGRRDHAGPGADGGDQRPAGPA